MKTLTKIEYVRRWLQSGKSITDNQARNSHIRYTRLAVAINRLRERGMWIINIGQPGYFAKYLMIDKGPIRNLMVKGHRIAIDDAHYINGLSDMRMLVTAYNGAHSVSFCVRSDAFRDKKIMKEAITENLKKIQ